MEDSEPVESEHGLVLSPITSFADCPPLDLICIPGGFGVNALLGDAEVLDFVRQRAAQARYITSVCTGSLVLGAAGLLKGRRASSHWMSREYLSDFGAIPVDERVVVDGNLITGGGVTAGIDFALTVVAEIAGADAAKAIQLAIEYNPSPPFDCGSPHKAPRALVESLREQWSASQKERKTQVTAAAQRLATG